MSIQVEKLNHQVLYRCKSKRNEVIVFHYKEGDRWETLVSSFVAFTCGGFSLTGTVEPFEMLDEIAALTRDVRAVTEAIDRAQRMTGDDYTPPISISPSRLLTKSRLCAVVADLYFALWERDQCGDCGGQGWKYLHIGDEVEKETCECAENAGTILAKTEHIAKAAANENQTTSD